MAAPQGKSPVLRRDDIKAALRRAKPADYLKLEELAIIWGVVKPAFVNVRHEIKSAVGFPDPIPGPRNSYLYPAKIALQAMWDYEVRNDLRTDARQKRADAILGRGAAGTDQLSATHTPSELAILSRLAADVEARELSQGLVTLTAEVTAVAAEVFSEISQFCATLENQVDPHGTLSPDIRERIRAGANKALLRAHARMAHLLDPDATEPSPDSAKPRRATRSPRRARP